jgi:hypothetical protein
MADTTPPALELDPIQRLAFRKDRGKSPSTSENGLWLSLVERLPRVQEAAGSNPASPSLHRPGTPSGSRL